MRAERRVQHGKLPPRLPSLPSSPKVAASIVALLLLYRPWDFVPDDRTNSLMAVDRMTPINPC